VLEELPSELCGLSTLTDLSVGYNRLASVRRPAAADHDVPLTAPALRLGLPQRLAGGELRDSGSGAAERWGDEGQRGGEVKAGDME
jgi:hypothetical protein